MFDRHMWAYLAVEMLFPSSATVAFWFRDDAAINTTVVSFYKMSSLKTERHDHNDIHLLMARTVSVLSSFVGVEDRPNSSYVV